MIDQYDIQYLTNQIDLDTLMDIKNKQFNKVKNKKLYIIACYTHDKDIQYVTNATLNTVSYGSDKSNILLFESYNHANYIYQICEKIEKEYERSEEEGFIKFEIEIANIIHKNSINIFNMNDFISKERV